MNPPYIDFDSLTSKFLEVVFQLTKLGVLSHTVCLRGKVFNTPLEIYYLK